VTVDKLNAITADAGEALKGAGVPACRPPALVTALT